MILSWLELSGFRAYRDLRFEPGEGVNVLIGDNGTGKTSVLEAIGYLASLRSFRGAPDGALVGEGAEEAIVRGEFVAGDRTSLVEAAIPVEGRRRFLLDGKRPKGRAEVAERVACPGGVPPGRPRSRQARTGLPARLPRRRNRSGVARGCR